jgi:predicted transcriptional regulator of viral defense system
MNYFTLRKYLEEIGLEIFTLNDVVKISEQKKEVVKSTLTRLVRQEKLYRLKANYYSLRKIENKFLFQKLYPNTYIGLHSALEYYGTTTQRFNNLDIITQKTLRNQSIENIEIDFHKIKNKLFFGFKKIPFNNTEVFISNIEKTIIDCTIFSSKVYLSDINECIRVSKEILNRELILNYLQKINSSTLNKRVGYLFELNGIDLIGLEINNKYERLNKNLGQSGTKDTKWKLVINEEF